MTDNFQFVVSHNSDEYSIEEATAAYADIKEGFTHQIADVSFKTNEFEDIIKEIKRTHADIKEYDYSRNKNSIYKKYIGENIRIYIRGNSIDMIGSFFTKDEESSNQLWKIYDKHSTQDDSIEIFMYTYSLAGNQLTEETKIIGNDDLKYISPLYYPYINTNLMFDQLFTGAENILLLTGAPGIGKTKYASLALKHALDNPDKLPYDKVQDNPAIEHQFVVAVSVKSVDVLGTDAFWQQLNKIVPDIVIIDDLDYMLTKRDAEVMSHEDSNKNSFLNQFLSFTDGVSKNNTKFIITTNQPYDDIDSALLRKGRLFDILEFRYLDKHEALDIWVENNLEENDFYEVFNSHEIVPADLGSEINKRLNTRIEFTTESYLKEDGISRVHQSGRSKKIKI